MKKTLFRGLRNEKGPVGGLAAAVLEGQRDAIGVLKDAMEDYGMEGPYILEQGKCYLVQTPTFYWLGRVRHVDWVKVILENVTQVFDTGSADSCLGKGTITNGEVYPKDVTVTINTDSITACPLWNHKLPPRIQ